MKIKTISALCLANKSALRYLYILALLICSVYALLFIQLYRSSARTRPDQSAQTKVLGMNMKQWNIDLNSSRKPPPANGTILILTPIRDGTRLVSEHLERIYNLDYPRTHISLGFLVSDTTLDQNTTSVLYDALESLRRRSTAWYRSISVVSRSFGQELGTDNFGSHSFSVQKERRSRIARARNYLLSTALVDEDWVVWIDVDVKSFPATILQDLVSHDRDVITPACLCVRKGRVIGYDYNSWAETDESRKVLDSLPPDQFIAEGYKDEIDTRRKYIFQYTKLNSDRRYEVELDGVGGTFLVVRGDVHRCGVNFPMVPFQHQAETEGFAKLAKANGYGVYGLPNYFVYHA